MLGKVSLYMNMGDHVRVFHFSVSVHLMARKHSVPVVHV